MLVPKIPLQNSLLRKSEPAPAINAAKHSAYYWRTDDDLTLYTQAWLPEQKPRAVINLIHGLGEHSSRYASWAWKFTQEAYIVRSFDLRGHGRSEGKRGYGQTYQHLLSDIAEFISRGYEEFGQLPAFLYGHGLGGNLVLNFAMTNIPTVQGIIITSPWLGLENTPPHFLMKFAKLLGKFLPGKIIKSGIRTENLSRELRSLYEFENDPLVHDRISIKLAIEIMEAGIRAAAGIYKINVPMLVMHGNSDRIASCRTTRDFVRNSGRKTTFIEWEGGYHELHMDLDREKVFTAIQEWINQFV